VDAFSRVFSSQVRDALRQQAGRQRWPHKTIVLHRLLNACDPDCEAWRIHLAAWLEFGEKHGALDNDRVSRLRLVHDWNAWNQVLNELRIPYFLARVYRLSVKYLPPTHGRKTPDVRIVSGKCQVNVEIKTPGNTPPFDMGRARTLGADTATMKGAIAQANNQFRRGEINLLAIGCQLLQVCPAKDDQYLRRALIGQHVLTWPVNVVTGETGQPYTEFRQDGKFQPERFTRVSGVLALSDTPYGADMRLVENRTKYRAPHQYHCVVHHNPYAIRRLDPDLLWGTRQLVWHQDGSGGYSAEYLWPEGRTYTFRGY